MNYEESIAQGGVDITPQFKPPTYEDVLKQVGVDITSQFKTLTYEDTIRQGGVDITKEFAPKPTVPPETISKPPLQPSSSTNIREKTNAILGVIGEMPSELKRIFYGWPKISPREGLYDIPKKTLLEKIPEFAIEQIPFREQILGTREWRSPETAMEAVSYYAAGKFLGEAGAALKRGFPKVAEFFTKPISKSITDTVWYRKMTIPERGMVVQSLDDMIAKGYTEGELLRKWGNPKWRKEALTRRIKGEEVPITEVPKPTEGIISKEQVKVPVQPTPEIVTPVKVAELPKGKLVDIAKEDITKPETLEALNKLTEEVKAKFEAEGRKMPEEVLREKAREVKVEAPPIGEPISGRTEEGKFVEGQVAEVDKNGDVRVGMPSGGVAVVPAKNVLMIGKELKPEAKIETLKPTELLPIEKVLPEVPPVKGEGVKQPWEMTKAEWLTQSHHPRDARFIGDQFHHDYVKEALATGKPVPPVVLKDYPELAKEAKVEVKKPKAYPLDVVLKVLNKARKGKELTPREQEIYDASRPTGITPVTADFEKPVPEKTISQFTEEYKEGLGESGFIRVGGVEKVTPKVVVPRTKDVSPLEFGLGTLHVADRHPGLAPIIKANIKAEQDTNNWILRKSDMISEAFDKVEKPRIWMKVFGRKGTGIRDLDLMIEGKVIVPERLKGFVTEINGILGDIKTEIIQKMKDDFADSLSPKQKEYLAWTQGGKVGDKSKYVRTGTITAVDEALTQFKEMETWGIQDYFPHIFKGKYKYLTEDGHIIASGSTAKQAKANFGEYVESHPETIDKTFMFVNDFYDLLTVRKTLNAELTNPLEYLGTRLSRKEFFRLLGRTEKVIKEEIANAGVADIPKVEVDMSGIASFQKGTKFSGHFLKRKTSLRGEETDAFKALMSYVFSVGRKLGLEDAKKTSYSFADSLPRNMPNAKSYIKMQADLISGRYNIIDKLFDETIGEKLGMKPFGVTRIFAKGVGLESKLKLGYAPAKTMVNRIGGVFHIILQEGGKNYYEGRKLLKIKDPDLISRIEREGHLAGMEQLFAGEGLIGVSKKQTSWWRPLGTYQMAEVKNRSEALAAAYVAGLKKFRGDKDAAWIYAIDSARLTQGLYSTAAKPVLVRGPVAQASYQFKQYLNNEIRFMSQLTPKQWAGYIPGITALSGTRGALLTIKSILGISVIGLGIDELMERLNRKAPRLHRGVFGLTGIDISAPASWQIPSSVKDWIGVFPRDIIETGEMIIKGLKNEGWTDEQINDYVRSIAPVGYNVLKGLQILSEGVIKEGTKVIYRGGKEEGIINFTGARSISQSQAFDSARYMNQQRRLFLDKSKVLEDKLFGSKSVEEASNTFKELVELKNIQTPEELQDFINGLRNSAKSRLLTEEARIFMTLPKALKKEEIRRR